MSVKLRSPRKTQRPRKESSKRYSFARSVGMPFFIINARSVLLFLRRGGLRAVRSV